MHTENNQQFTSIEVSQLSDVSGGFGIPGWLKFAGGKVLGPIGAAYSGYQAANKFLSDRSQHKSLGRSLWDGAMAYIGI